MSGKFAFLLLVPILAVLGLVEVQEAEGCWRRGWRRPAPPGYPVYSSYPAAVPGTLDLAARRVLFRDPNGVLHWVIDSLDRDVSEEGVAVELEKVFRKDAKLGAEARKVKKWDGSDGETFARISRRAAKTSIAAGDPTPFATFQAFRNWLPSQTHMEGLDISGGANSGRVKEEQHNVAVVCYLYAAAKMDDNDFHLIIGGGPGAPTNVKMNVEISGLPLDGPDRPALLAVREEFKAFCLQNWGAIPGSTYKYCQPPLRVRITGSIFFDVEHGPFSVGPVTLRKYIDSSWEIHPITRFEVIGN